MPDLDKVERKLLPAWRAPYGLVKGNHPLEEVAKSVLKVLSETLRREGGLPCLPELAMIVQQRDAGRLDDRSLSAIAFKLEQRMRTRTERLALAALQRPEVSGPASMLLGRPDQRLAEGLLVRMVENILFSQQRDYLVGKRFASREDAISFENDLLSMLRPHIGHLARRLVRNPQAHRLRAPSFPIPHKKTTADLLDQPL
jgi:hypothetical protein